MQEKTDQRLSWGTIIVSGLLFVACAPRHGGVPPLVPTPALTQAARPASPVATPPLPTAYGKLPLAFEVNQGQSDPSVQFLARGRGYALLLTPTEAVLSLRQGEEAKREKGEEEQGAGTRHRAPGTRTAFAGRRTQDSGRSAQVVRLQLAGANPQPRMEGLDALPGKVNYFLGNDPSQWRTNVQTYAKVKYHEVYPGIDVVYYGNQEGRLEHDFIVAPGVDPSVIQFSLRDYAGAELPLTADAEGNLLIQVADATLRLGKPLVYQEIGGERREVAGTYVLPSTEHPTPRTPVGFQLAAYDPAYPVIIDPTFIYSTYLGGSSTEAIYGIAADLNGNAYLGGITASADMPLQPPGGGFAVKKTDVFVAKMSPDGQTLLYATYLGGSSYDTTRALAIDGSGNVYVTGETESTNLPTVNALRSTYAGGSSDAFVMKLSTDGATLLYSTYLGGGEYDSAEALVVDGDGQAHVAGITRSTNFPTATPFQATKANGNEAFVAKLSADGTTLLYGTYLGGNGSDIGHAVAVDASGHMYVMGVTTSTDFPTMTPFQATPGSNFNFDVFVTKLSADGQALLYSTYVGGNGSDEGFAMAVDAGGHAYVAGGTRSTDFPTAEPLQATNAGSFYDGFVFKLNATGTALEYSTYLGGNTTDTVYAIALDGIGQAYVTGGTYSTDFPTAAPLQDTMLGDEDIFVAQISADGTALLFSTYLGGTDDFGLEEAYAIAVDSGGNVYLGGETYSPSFPTAVPFQATLVDVSDAFLVKLDMRIRDDDGDGLPDTQDNCPGMQNAVQTDTDGDNIGDACEGDSDNDGIPDSSDTCPTAWNPLGQSNDRDGDGVADACDNCQSVANADQLDSDHNGRGDVCEIDVDLLEPKRPRRGRQRPLDPALLDSDGDGLTDAVEAARGLVPTNPDSDSDGVPDGTDNCPLPGFANADQADADHDTVGDVCDSDDDNDFVADANDNCPLIANTNQRNRDGDELGDACDPDADGDGVPSLAAGGTDCNDHAASVYLGATEIPGNNRDDDCDPKTLDRQLALMLELSDPVDPKATAATWLPTVGRQVTLTARVTDDLHQSVGSPEITLFVRSASALPGQYTNDASTDGSTDYVVESSSGNQVVVRTLDYGGTLTLQATGKLTLADGTSVVLQKIFTLPSDRDGDGLPDVWEDQFGDLDPNEDFDTSEGNPYVGDGLSAFAEYRGFVWGPPLVRVGPDAVYQTPAYILQGSTVHFRSHPFRKDLFLKWSGYGGASPFALGTVFIESAGLDVHAADAASAPGEARIDALVVRNDLTGTYQGANGHINKRGMRDWLWDTKGASGQGDATTYGAPETYQPPLDYYFADLPYTEGTTPNQMLDALTAATVEDNNDNGVLETVAGKNEDRNKNGMLDGDRVMSGQYGQALSALDVDNDGLVELPIVSNPLQISPQYEYSKAQVLMHTITHEVGHALGMNHNQDTACLMYEKTPNWSRAGCLSPSSKVEIQIHNQ